MLDKFYYVDVFVNGEEKTPWYVPQFMFGRSSQLSVSFPYIYYCDFQSDGIHILSSGNQKEKLFISYSEIKWIDLLVVRRRWGIGILTMMIPWFDFDLIVHREHDEIEIEFPAFFEFRDVIESRKESGLFVMDHLDVFKRFPDEKSFKENFSAYFEKNYHEIAQQYGLEDPRIGFKNTQW